MTVAPLTAYNFRVRLGALEIGFSKLSGLRREVENFTYREGGLNDRVHVLPGSVQTCGTVRLERGAYVGEHFPFYLAGERLDMPMRVEVWPDGDATRLGKVYTLTGLVVKKWEVSELDAVQNTLLIDRFELNYAYLSVAVS